MFNPWIQRYQPDEAGFIKFMPPFNSIKKECNFCHKIIWVWPSLLLKGKGKYCSKGCYDKMQVGQKVGENSKVWKGNKVGYRALHHWIERKLGKPNKCEFCQKEGFTGKQIGWANKGHVYKRELSNWVRLCVSCHMKYDMELGLRIY